MSDIEISDGIGDSCKSGIQIAQPQSKECTEWKERGFRECMELITRLSFGPAGSLSEWYLWWIDMHCGIGTNIEVGCDGSPIEFIKVVQSLRRKYFAVFCDKGKEIIDVLKERVKKLGEPRKPNEICYRDEGNKGLLPIIAELISKLEPNPKYSVGGLLLDPKGTAVADTPYQEVYDFSAIHKRIDIVWNFNVRAFNRALTVARNNAEKIRNGEPTNIGCWGKSTKQRGFNTLDEFLAKMHKKFWLIREPVGTNNTYVILVGRNRENASESKRLGFYEINTPHGIEIRRSLGI